MTITRSRTAPALVAALAIALPGASARAQTSEDWHFTSDASRHARVDDRGGLGEGYSFSVGYDPDDGNSEDYCPHCRLTVMTSDPGIDLAELERVGISRSSLGTAESLLSALQGVAAADPTGLAMELAPGLSGADLDAFVAEITAIQARIVDVVTALELFATIEGGSFDWSGSTLDALRTALSLRMDTAFRGDFSDPNDPRIHNSGVRVYGLDDLLTGLAGQGVPDAARTQIQSALTSIPGLTGTFEISGDDDDVMQPASFHGYHTDLTIRQRTYVIDGQSAYLVVYTIANETTRVFPMVEVSMMDDFDIPPLSYDTATEYDATQQAVLLYDTIPYTDPEQHEWFGMAPARATPGAPGEFALAQWNVDQSFTLAQFGSDTTQDNRYRFLLGDPAIAGDHDSAMGKSEKQGAIAMRLGGPLLPGDQRSVAFCFAEGTGTSSSAARAAMTATLTGCRALYTALTPSCGDGVWQYPEECDAPSDPTCSASCHHVVCGDGRLDGDEQCDDGNTAADDGCSDTCRTERCGDGITQASESCDDGNDSSLDACLPDCTVPRCGDGIVRMGTACAGADCGCAGYDQCLTGSFTIGTVPSGSSFASLSGVAVDYRIGFDVVSTDTTTLASQGGIRVTTGPLHVEMSGAPLAASIASRLEGRTWTLDLINRPARGVLPFSTSRVQGGGGRTPVVGFELFAMARTGVSWSSTLLGTPILSTLRMTAGTARLTLVPSIGTPTDVVTGPARGAIGYVPPGTAGELCDDGNTSDFDACTSACVPAACGDGIVQVAIGEECDGGPMPPAWCTGCVRTGSSCGNGTVEAGFGEECDDGNVADDDGCSAICRTEACGDGVVQSGEECDDGANGDGDGCTDACVVESCGDGIVQPREACDDGMISDTGACVTGCVPARCGDALVQEGVEECDDGNDVVGDGCSPGCAADRCGDGLPGTGEDCDDGNTIERDGCSPTCAFEICGDGAPGPEEQCDDGNVVDGDGCDKDCRLEDLDACGDGLVGTGEQCDDGGHASGDGCSEFCQLEDPDACGDGSVDPGEGCDDGNTTGGDGCSARCSEERCGDGVQAFGEGCDDGNTTGGDGCSELCAIEPSECGNGVHEYGEQCDGEDGCSADCEATTPAPLGDTCGDGALDYGEECDDGGRLDGNGCDGTCQLEASVCGNARLERGERCDDGNAEPGDGCDAACDVEGELMPPIPMPTPSAGCTCAVGTRAPGPGALVLLGLALAWALRRRAR